jgi:hypothetical protein
MILENYTPEVAFEDIEIVASPDYIGEAGELTAISVDALTEMHNLTIALARVEHKCIVESNDALLEVAVPEFLKKAGQAIADFFKRVVAWIGSMLTKLKDVFVKREDWLKRNIGAINGATAEQLTAVGKVKIGKNMLGQDFAGIVSESAKMIEGFVNGAHGLKTAEEKKSFVESIKAKAGQVLAKSAKAVTTAEVHAARIGEDEEVDLDKSKVSALIKVAQDTFRAAAGMGSLVKAAQTGQKFAEQMAAGQNASDDKEVSNARLGAISDAGHAMQTMISALSSIVGAANGKAMPILVKVASAAGKKAKEAAPAADEKKDSVNASTDILAAFM